MKAFSSLGYGIQKLPLRTEIGRGLARDLAEYDERRYGKLTLPTDWSDLELRTLAAAGISMEDFLRL